MSGMIDPQIFEHLKTKIDEDTKAKDDLNGIIQKLERDVSYTQGLLSRVHSAPRSHYPALLSQVETAIKTEADDISQLSEVASQHPYYKYAVSSQQNQCTQLICGFTGTIASGPGPSRMRSSRYFSTAGWEVPSSLREEWDGSLPSRRSERRSSTVSQASTKSHPVHDHLSDTVVLVPVNLKDRDAFHITIEEYLLAVTGLTDELARLAVNAVTLGDHELAVKISAFVKDIHAGFQLLNLKNDILRKRVDGVKYAVKKVEDVVYDLSLRNLIPTS